MNTYARKNSEISIREKRNADLSRQIAAEGIVLLENDGVLPIKAGKIALYGAGAEYTIAGGSGSGEVNSRYSVSVLEGLKNAGFDITTMDWIRSYDRLWKKGKEEFIREGRKKLFPISVKVLAALMAAEYAYPSGDPISEEEVKGSDADTCIYVVSRQSGEGHDRRDEKGNFRLDDIELHNIRICAASYDRFILVINSGCIIDLSDLDGINGINAIVYMGQLGMEGGNALADVLTGKICPSGKLSVSWPMSYKDVPFGDEFGFYAKDKDHALYKEGIYVGYRYYDAFEKEVRYPFGYGKSYTRFSFSDTAASMKGKEITVEIKIKNTGLFSGKEAAGLYVSMKDGFSKLVAFSKSRQLEPGEEETLKIAFPLSYLSVYDETAAETVLEEDDHILYAGTSVKDKTPIAVLHVEKRIVLSKHRNLCCPKKKIGSLSRRDEDTKDHQGLPVIGIPEDLFVCRGYSYEEKKEPFSETVSNLLKSFKEEDLVRFCTGTGLFGEDKGFKVPGAVGHSTTDYIEKGIRNVEFCDGPAGLRLQRRSALTKKGKIKAIDASISLYEFLPSVITKFLKGDPDKDEVLYQFVTGFPIAAVLAQTWNDELAVKMGEAVSEEMKEYGVSYWLAPAMNIVRNPLCGRNYEYYSEDPVLSAKMASNIVKGVQSKEGCFAVVKHFAVNNQESERYFVSSDLDERVLREIYLKGFEIAVKESAPKAVMSAYNRINGTYCANNEELCTQILRNEWDFDGIVMTDWLSTGKDRADEALCIRSGVDLIMPGGKGVIKKLLQDHKEGKLSRKDLERAAGRFLNQITK
ncbi:MAG: glycoside hydrolase family 3 C-terminal domain-containing protein [Erysipelotrichaceae bacterium]|nr:glycoside hydrolase family 3 C-terminal domain-containing protein [Erysipelotrichaceae bacterium]